jgi:hypothetical protein
MDMKKLIQQMTDIENSAKKTTLNESATLTVTADNAEQIAQLLGIMKNAGLSHAKPVGGDMPLPKGGDDSKFQPGAATDDPSIPGRDDVAGDQDLNQGLLGTIAGGALGTGLGLATGAGPMATTLGALSGAAAGDSLTDGGDDDPNIPGRDDVEGDQDLQAGVLDTLAGMAGQAGGAIARGAQTVAQSDIGQAVGGVVDAVGDAGADLGARAGEYAVDTLGPERIAQLAGQGDTYRAASDTAQRVPDILGARDAAQGVVDASVASRAAEKGSELGRTAGKAALGGAAAATGVGAAKALGGDDDEKKESGYANEPDEEFSDQEKMIHDMSGGMNREKKQYKAAQRGDNAMAVEGAPDLSPKFIKHLQVTFDDKEMLSRSETRKVEDMLNKLSIKNIKTLVRANIPHVSDMAKEYMRNNTPGGMKNYGEDMIETIKAQLMAALSEKKKPDANKNGIPDYAEDGKGPNDLAKGKKGSKPKKGQVPPQFKKKTNEADYNTMAALARLKMQRDAEKKYRDSKGIKPSMADLAGKFDQETIAGLTRLKMQHDAEKKYRDSVRKKK